MKMKAALAREIDKLTIEEVELAPPKDSEVLVRMQAAGVGAFLVGEAFMRAPDPGKALASLFFSR